MPIYRQLPENHDIDNRLNSLKNSGLLVGSDAIIDKKLNDLANEVKLGQIGAKGEITFLERQIFSLGRSVEIIPESVQKNVKIPDYAVYLNQGETLKSEITEIKTTVKTTNVSASAGWDQWIKKKIRQANKQLKKSGLTYGIPGSLEMQLYEDAEKDFSAILFNEPETVAGWILQDFRSNQMRSLRRVAIYGNGELLVEFIRTEDHQIIKTFPE
ncbi:hypothetical protein [Oscillatoria acuminata]|uniref:Uncharacterized protein n=1 Tax=Oscillatoria acuminata PCC 6304 TaxID=56110 RepID=K9TBQ9_9CYAN|nr:hypothetical protein [Oscillatoria acuminata]AFY79980.1 hypothetical protein Oscil6304_0227 [Oscillatoria acuminata PCC 6304]